MPDNPPTPAEIDQALAVLHRVPGVGGPSTLDAIAQRNHPMWRLGEDLSAWALNPRLRTGATASTVANELNEIAARHGLRITDEPDRGEVIKLVLVRQAPEDGRWLVCNYFRPGDTIPTDLMTNGMRVATMHLLPEGVAGPLPHGPRHRHRHRPAPRPGRGRHADGRCAMTQTPRPTPPPPPITAAVYLPTTAPLPADPTPAARRWCADVAEAESLGHAALVLRYAHALSALRTVWRSRSRRIAAAAPRVITDPAELDALPTGAVVLDHARPRDAYTKRAHGYGWYGTGSSLSATSSEVLRWGEGRVTVLFVPTEEAR